MGYRRYRRRYRNYEPAYLPWGVLIVCSVVSLLLLIIFLSSL